MLIVRKVKTYDVKIGDMIWAQADGGWLRVWDVRDNGYGDVSFHGKGALGGAVSFVAGAPILVREDIAAITDFPAGESRAISSGVDEDGPVSERHPEAPSHAPGSRTGARREEHLDGSFGGDVG